MRKRLLAALLCLCVLVTLLPEIASAAGESAISLGADGIPGYNSTAGYHYIYMGTYSGSPVKWRVLDDKTNTGATGLFLLSEVLLGTGVVFKNSAPYINAWQNSDAQGWCSAFAANSLTEKELAAVLATTKSDAAFTSSLHRMLFYAYESILAGDKVFFLSAEEVENSAYGFTNDGARKAYYGGSNMMWWLRSPAQWGAGIVAYDGTVNGYDVSYGLAARPAFNLDQNSVLFTSAAAGGKLSGAVGPAALRPNLVPAGTREWKLTLGDNSRDFAISDISRSGDTVSFNYSGATVGTDEYISAIIKDSGGNITCYGRIAQPSAASGAAAVDLSGVAVNTGDTLYIFSEQYNGGTDDDTKLTDYASVLMEISLGAPPVSPTITTTTLPGGTVDTAYSKTLAATGTAPITWSMADGSDPLPGGLTLSAGGAISGTPTAAGTFNFTVEATNATGNDTQALSIIISPKPVAPTITTTTLPGGTADTAYNQTLAATGTAPIVWSKADGTLPLGLTLSAGGVISGTPTTAGTFTFTVKATNAAGSDTQELSISVAPVPPTITGAGYDTVTGVLKVTGTRFAKFYGGAADIDVTKLTITGEGGVTYTLTHDTADVEATDYFSFSVTLGAADKGQRRDGGFH